MELSVAYDPTCNLSCPSCRNEIFRCTTEKKADIETIHDCIVKEGMEKAGLITIATNGDPFASPYYLKTLREFDWHGHPELKLMLITNGLRLTPEMWDSISGCHQAIVRLQVSVNAATKETFAINQRGGEFNRLMKNLEFIAALRRAGKLRELCFGFYTLDNNFREMKRFVEMAKSFAADKILFGHIMKASSHSDEDFQKIAVHLPEHPLHAEFLEVLRDPVFQDPIVELFNNQALANAAGAIESDHAPGNNTCKPERISWEEFEDFFQIDASNKEEIRAHINTCKSEFAQLFLAAPVDGGLPPIGLLLEGAPQEALDEFLHTRIPSGYDAPYVGEIYQFQLTCQNAIASLLCPTARQVIHLLPVQSFTGVDTGFEPFAAAVEEFQVRLRRGEYSE